MRATENPSKLRCKLKENNCRWRLTPGPSLSLVSEATCQRLWPNKRLLPVTTTLKTYSGESLNVRGSLLVGVQHNGQGAKLSLLVVKGDGPSLLGRDWLQQLQIDWQTVNRVHESPLDELLNKHKAVFEEGLGTLRCY